MVQRGVYDELVGKLTGMAGHLKVGDPLERDTVLGPVITGTHHQGRLGVQNRQSKRELVETIDQFANDVTALVAKKQAGQHLDLKVGA